MGHNVGPGYAISDISSDDGVLSPMYRSSAYDLMIRLWRLIWDDKTLCQHILNIPHDTKDMGSNPIPDPIHKNRSYINDRIDEYCNFGIHTI